MFVANSTVLYWTDTHSKSQENVEWRALFLISAHINHSCSPNAQGVYNSHTGHHTVHAIRDIDQNQEITMQYKPLDAEVRQERQKNLAGLGIGSFTCICTICTVDRETMYVDDRFRKDWKTFKAGLNNWKPEHEKFKMSTARERLEEMEIQMPKFGQEFWDGKMTRYETGVV